MDSDSFKLQYKPINVWISLLEKQLSKEVVCKWRHGLRGRGVSRILWRQYTKVLLLKCVTMGGGGVKKLPKFCDVIYGRPPNSHVPNRMTWPWLKLSTLSDLKLLNFSFLQLQWKLRIWQKIMKKQCDLFVDCWYSTTFIVSCVSVAM